MGFTSGWLLYESPSLHSMVSSCDISTSNRPFPDLLGRTMLFTAEPRQNPPHFPIHSHCSHFLFDFRVVYFHQFILLQPFGRPLVSRKRVQPVPPIPLLQAPHFFDSLVL